MLKVIAQDFILPDRIDEVLPLYRELVEKTRQETRCPVSYTHLDVYKRQALLHSQAVTEKRGSFRGWTLLLAIAAFSLSLMGAFLVRSGVLTSVHAFAADPSRGLFILVFLGIVIGGSLLLYVLRSPRLGGGAPFTGASRETLLLFNNVLLTSAAGMVLLGTLYPLSLIHISCSSRLGIRRCNPPARPRTWRPTSSCSCACVKAASAITPLWAAMPKVCLLYTSRCV